MGKKLMAFIGILAAGLIIISGCAKEEEAPAAPTGVSYQILDNQGLKITWDEVEDADGYYIYVDGVIIDTVEETEWSENPLTHFGKFELAAYNDEGESETVEVVDMTCVKNEGVVLGTGQATEPSLLYWTGSGFDRLSTADSFDAWGVVARAYGDPYVPDTWDENAVGFIVANLHGKYTGSETGYVALAGTDHNIAPDTINASDVIIGHGTTIENTYFFVKAPDGYIWRVKVTGIQSANDGYNFTITVWRSPLEDFKAFPQD